MSMHATDWIALYGNRLRSVSAASLRRALNRPKHHCTWCGKPVSRRRKTWCSQACIDAFMERQPGVCAKRTIQRDRGVCQLCRLDTYRIRALLVRLYLLSVKDPCWYAVWRSYMLLLNRKGFFLKLQHPYELELAQADHILPVCRGGGLCDISGYRTLCVPCHVRITKTLNRAISREKRKVKQKKRKG